MKNWMYVIPAVLSVTVAKAEVSSDGIFTKVKPFLNQYGQTLIMQAEYETHPFAFLKELKSSQLQGVNVFSSFDPNKNILMILKQDENQSNAPVSLLLSGDLIQGLYDVPVQTAFSEATVGTPLTNGTFQKLEAINDIASGTDVYEGVDALLHGGNREDDQTRVSEFLANQYETHHQPS